MSNIPIIRLEIEGMRHSIMAALTENFAQRDADLQEAIKEVCETYPWRSRLINEAQQALDFQIRELSKSIAKEILSDYEIQDAIRKNVTNGVMRQMKIGMGIKVEDEPA